MIKKSAADLVGVTVNSGRGSLVLTWPDGQPLLAGQIRQGDTVVFERVTGRILRVKSDVRKKGKKHQEDL